MVSGGCVCNRHSDSLQALPAGFVGMEWVWLGSWGGQKGYLTDICGMSSE